MTDLTQEELRRVLDYNPDTGVFTWLVSPARCVPRGSVAGGIQSTGYRLVRIKRKYYRAGRLAWFYIHGVWPSDEVDHVNGDRDDQRSINLRDVSRTENNRNLRRSRRNTSGTVGVTWHKRDEVFVACIGEQYLGRFKTKDDAVAARKSAEQKLNYHPNHGRGR